MEKTTKSIEARDRLSELPDSLILKIFEFMPTRDVVRTPILSSRWKNLWTISPYLCFRAIRGDNNDDLRRFVNRALLRWRGVRVQNFKVSRALFEHSIFTDMDLWLRFAVDNRVEDLDISFRRDYDIPDIPDYCPPKCLYSCPSLLKLSINRCSLRIKGGVEWSRLKSLKIDCSSATQQMIEQVLSGSPLLEEFSLTFEAKDVNSELSFRSSSLKKLSICQILDNTTESTLVALRIWTPNLLVLTLSGDPSYTNCLLENVSSLARANLLFVDWTWDDFVGKTLTQILPAIQHVEGLTLSQPCVKALGAMRSNSLLPPFSNVKFLSLYNRFDECENILRLLEIFPKLKTLVVDDDGGYFDSKVKFKPNPSNPFLAELKTVEVTWFAGRRSVIFQFIKILLKHASKLEKLVFRVRRHVALDDLFLASKELLGMPRSSPRAKLVFHEY